MSTKFLWQANCIAISMTALISSQFYNYYTQYSYGLEFSMYDSWYFGMYYYTVVVFHLYVLAVLSYQLLPAKSRFWALIKQLVNFVLLIESEAIGNFLLHINELENNSDSSEELTMSIVMLVFGLMRWALALASAHNCQMFLHKQACRNSLATNVIYGCLAQNVADYIVLHYLLYTQIHSLHSQLPQSMVHYGCILLLALFYARYARKEITFGRFYV